MRRSQSKSQPLPFLRSGNVDIQAAVLCHDRDSHAGGFKDALLTLAHELRDTNPFLLLMIEPAIKRVQEKYLEISK